MYYVDSFVNSLQISCSSSFMDISCFYFFCKVTQIISHISYFIFHLTSSIIHLTSYILLVSQNRKCYTLSNPFLFPINLLLLFYHLIISE